MTQQIDIRPHIARKRFGQHFLHDPAVIRRILRAIDPRPGQTLVEIGPGLGALTGALLTLIGHLHAIELDRDLARRLTAQFPQTLSLHIADALDFDFTALANANHSLRIVGNLPYNISTPLLFHLLTQSQHIRDMHFMFQREVANRITASPGDIHYGRLSVMTQWHCQTQKLFDIGPGAFRPPPRITSSIVRLTVRAQPPAFVPDLAILQRLVARAFSQRRKTLRNSLRKFLTPDRIRAAGIDPGARPETLNLLQFAALSAQVMTTKNNGK
uniref:Ribosomal RNA small subunit methyltransferase A n=1 Tax=Candidatus Kentrum sp. MB TaxID=2138164 RepID=A0A451B9Q3_9GAMM|nr:MAG: dimethyladenosine transferase [Candidatus Kentron sp. MB]VFK29852.1 MAG: dimethyladenosine transferase [Candidatus Kentron sp. MB]VFK74967.1 MAG: dimethyladenosine transferase [Candidatus Kentron sp. MB]